jgi:hypothetical protein
MAKVAASDTNPAKAASITSPAITPVMAAAIRAQQVEKLHLTAALKANPGAYTQYQTQRVNQIVGDVSNAKHNAFEKAQAEVSDTLNAQNNVNQYMSYSINIGAATDAMLRNNEAIQNAVERDKDITRRQFEINEWSNYNKLDTLFYLQLFFICSLIATIILYLAKSGAVPMGLAVVMYGLLALILVIVGVSRYYYTAHIRDSKLWHRRFFGAAPDPGTGGQCPPVTLPYEQHVSTALASVAANVERCAGNIAGNTGHALDQLGDAATNEMVGLIQGRTSVLDQLSSVSNGACNKNY